MTNRPLVITLGAIAIAYITALSAVLVLYDGDKLAVVGILSGAMALLIPQMLSLKQSADNNSAITRVSDKLDSSTVDQSLAISKISTEVKANTAITEDVKTVSDTTHAIVNSRMDEFKAALQEVASMREEAAATKAEMVAVRAELAAASELARGITIGRHQKVGDETDTTVAAAEQQDVAVKP
jgi:hypothetical protein